MYPEMQANWTPFNAERSSIFEWFASIYADVITKDLFDFYCSEDMNSLLDFFVGLGFIEEVGRVVEAIDEIDGSEASRIALAEDFKTLFLTKKSPTAPPLASIYLSQDDIDFLNKNLPLSAFLEHNKLPLNPAFNDAEDHISVYLAAISAWCLAVVDEKDPAIMESIAQVQGMYLEVAMLSWINDWERVLHDVEGTHFDFYQAISSLLCSFIELDALVLNYDQERQAGDWDSDVAPADRTLH